MNTPYQKYLILSVHRSGTNYLTSLLDSHPYIVSHYEVFREYFFHGQHVFWKGIRWISPEYFLNRYVYHHYPGFIRAVGFELQYSHARHGREKSIWGYLHNHKEITIIHLKRMNLLRMYISFLLATKSGIWTTTKERALPPTPIELDYDFCRMFFVYIEHKRSYFDGYFQHHNVKQLTYESLTANTTKELRSIQNFLSVPPLRLHSPLKKINVYTLQQIIKNYSSLKRSFAQTAWARFFDE